MKTYAKKLLLTSVITLGLVGGSLHYANAASVDVPATVTVRPALTIAKTTDMAFGILELTGAATGDIVLKTDDSIDVSGATNVAEAAGNTSTAGVVTITTDGSSPLDITCSTGATLKDSGGTNTLALTATTIVATSGATAFSTDHVCTGALEASLITPTSNDVVVAIGATIADIDTQSVPATANTIYSTANTGGVPITFTAVYH